MSNYWLDMENMNGTAKFRGKFQEAEPYNKQGRCYSKDVLEKAIAAMLIESKLRAKKRKYRWGLDIGRI